MQHNAVPFLHAVVYLHFMEALVLIAIVSNLEFNQMLDFCGINILNKFTKLTISKMCFVHFFPKLIKQNFFYMIPDFCSNG